MIEDLKVIIDNHGLFLILFFSGVLFGVVAQKMIDNQPVKPYIKRIARCWNDNGYCSIS